MSMMASQITSLTIVYSTVYSAADQRKYQSSVSLAFVRGPHRWPVNSPQKWSVTRKMFPFDDVTSGHASGKFIHVAIFSLFSTYLTACRYNTVRYNTKLIATRQMSVLESQRTLNGIFVVSDFKEMATGNRKRKTVTKQDLFNVDNVRHVRSQIAVHTLYSSLPIFHLTPANWWRLKWRLMGAMASQITSLNRLFRNRSKKTWKLRVTGYEDFVSFTVLS